MDGTVLGLGHRLALDARFQRTGRVLLDKVLDRLDAVLAQVGVVQRVLGSGLNVLDGAEKARDRGKGSGYEFVASSAQRGYSQSRELLFLKVKTFSVLSEFDSVDPDKVDLALVLLREGLEGLEGRFLVGGIGLGEVVSEGKTRLGVGRKVLRANLIDQGDRFGLDESLEAGGFKRLVKLDLGFVELAVKNDSGGGDTSGLGDLRVARKTEQKVVAVLLGDSCERGEVGAVIL